MPLVRLLPHGEVAPREGDGDSDAELLLQLGSVGAALVDAEVDDLLLRARACLQQWSPF